MKWNRCQRRPETSLLVAGALGEVEKMGMERHLAECAECRTYCAEIKAVVEPLGAWEKSLSGVEVTPAMRMRWASAIKNEGVASAGVQLNTAPPGSNKPLALTLSPLRGAREAETCMGAVPRHAPSAVRPSSWQRAWRVVWHELIRPSRYAWTGMAAVWLVMLVINGTLSGHEAGGVGAVAASPREMMQAWEEQNRVLAELSRPAFGFVTPAPLPGLLKPRSEREEGWKIV